MRQRYLALLFILECALGTAWSSGVSRETVVYAAHSWRELHSAYITLGKDADGVVAGAFVDRISRLLDEHWDQLPKLASIVERDPEFRQFILNNLGDAVPAESEKRVKLLAKTTCPSSARQLCRDILFRLSR